MAGTRPPPARDNRGRVILTPEQARQVGAELLLARPKQVPWKILEKRYGLKRATLLKLQKEARSAPPRRTEITAWQAVSGG
jgi:hypothetical protein